MNIRQTLSPSRPVWGAGLAPGAAAGGPGAVASPALAQSPPTRPAGSPPRPARRASPHPGSPSVGRPSTWSPTAPTTARDGPGRTGAVGDQHHHRPGHLHQPRSRRPRRQRARLERPAQLRPHPALRLREEVPHTRHPQPSGRRLLADARARASAGDGADAGSLHHLQRRHGDHRHAAPLQQQPGLVVEARLRGLLGERPRRHRHQHRLEGPVALDQLRLQRIREHPLRRPAHGHGHPQDPGPPGQADAHGRDAVHHHRGVGETTPAPGATAPSSSPPAAGAPAPTARAPSRAARPSRRAWTPTPSTS